MWSFTPSDKFGDISNMGRTVASLKTSFGHVKVSISSHFLRFETESEDCPSYVDTLWDWDNEVEAIPATRGEFEVQIKNSLAE